MKPLLSKDEIADLLAPLEPEAEIKTSTTEKARQSKNDLAEGLHNQSLQIRVEVGRSRVLLKELLQIKKGSLLNLNAFTDKPLDLYIDNHLIASCELVQVGGIFSIKVIEVTVPT